MLTLSEKKTYQYIKQYFDNHCHAPTTSEVAQGIGIASRGVVHRYLKALQSKGYIKLTPKRHRNIVLLEQREPIIPLVGSIAAGKPIEAVVDNDSIDIVNLFTGKNRFALRVKGESMIDEGIQDGDLIVCESASTAVNGQIVVALIDNQEATLKRLYHNDNNTITLLPANPAYKPQIYPAERVSIQGLYIGLLRVV